MVTINSILAGLVPAVASGKVQSPQVADLQDNDVRHAATDTYRSDEAWRNRAKAHDLKQTDLTGPSGQVALAYQGQPYLPVSVSSSPPSENQSDTDTNSERDYVETEGSLDTQQGAEQQALEGEQGDDVGLGPTTPEGRPLSAAEKQFLAKLQEADVKVKAHEKAHLAAAGGFATGGASYKYQQGPDGKKYAVGGEVPIDVSKEASPDQTIAKMRIVRRAALAPTDPSPQDQSVAAQATLSIAESAQELRFTEDPKGNVLREAAEDKADGPGTAKEKDPYLDDSSPSVFVGLQSAEEQESPLNSFSSKAYKIAASAGDGDQQSPSTSYNLFA